MTGVHMQIDGIPTSLELIGLGDPLRACRQDPKKLDPDEDTAESAEYSGDGDHGEDIGKDSVGRAPRL